MVKKNGKILKIIVIPSLKPFLPKSTTAITFWPIILFLHHEFRANDRIVRHEQIHLKQQKELLIVFFYLAYLLEYLYHLMRTLNHKIAYRAISFEKEAYRYDNVATYLNTRKVFAMWR